MTLPASSLVLAERLNRLDQADRPDRDQILHIIAGVVELFDNMNKICLTPFAEAKDLRPQAYTRKGAL